MLKKKPPAPAAVPDPPTPSPVVVPEHPQSVLVRVHGVPSRGIALAWAAGQVYVRCTRPDGSVLLEWVRAEDVLSDG